MNPTVNGSAACAGGEANAAGRASVTAASKNERREAGGGERREGNVSIGPSKMRGVSGSFPPAQFLVTFQVWGLPALVKGRAVRHPGAHDHSDAAAANRCWPPSSAAGRRPGSGNAGAAVRVGQDHARGRGEV